MAGTIADLAKDTLPRDFRHIDTRMARVVLIEAGPRVLAGFPDDLSAYAQRALESLGVEVVLGAARHRMRAPTAWSMAASKLAARTIVWAAGVRASRAAEWLNAPADRAQRLQVEPDLTVPGHPDIFAVGDTVTIDGRRRQSGARHRAGRQAGRTLRRRADQGAAATARRCRRSTTSTPAASRRSASGSR